MDNRQEEKIDKIQSDIVEIKVIMAKNTTSLEEHMRRTNLLENRIEPLEKNMYKILGAIGVLAVLIEIFLRH